MSEITNGPVVNQHMQTSEDSVSACGNVVHVNDLVDNVTVESMTAGKYAAQYALGTMPETVRRVEVSAGSNIRYLCPQVIDIPKENAKIKLYFRVIYPDRDVKIAASSGNSVIAKRSSKVVNPGEMETIQIDTEKAAGDNVKVEVIAENISAKEA